MHRVADGGTGLPPQLPQNSSETPSRAPSIDGGTFHSQNWRQPSSRF
jgi:hypothetical protein